MATGPFVKVYQSIADDPMFERVFDRPVLATWLRMLLLADAMYPVSAPIGRLTPDKRLLIEVGLVIHLPGNRYSMRGQRAERERRSDAARNAAAMRWQSVRNAEAMPLREEKRRAEQTNGLAPSFIRYRVPGEALAPIHDGRHGKVCLVCFPVEAKP